MVRFYFILPFLLTVPLFSQVHRDPLLCKREWGIPRAVPLHLVRLLLFFSLLTAPFPHRRTGTHFRSQTLGGLPFLESMRAAPFRSRTRGATSQPPGASFYLFPFLCRSLTAHPARPLPRVASHPVSLALNLPLRFDTSLPSLWDNPPFLAWSWGVTRCRLASRSGCAVPHPTLDAAPFFNLFFWFDSFSFLFFFFR